MCIFTEKLLALCPTTIIKEENKEKSAPPPELNPPIITHTAATPMPTPQGSPNEHGSKDYNKVTLSVHPQMPRGSLSFKSSSVSYLPSWEYLSRMYYVCMEFLVDTFAISFV